MVSCSQEKENSEHIRAQADITTHREKLTETNKELAVEVGSLRRAIAEREQQLKQSLEETATAKTQCDELAQHLSQLKQSLEEAEKYRLNSERLAKQLTDMKAGDEVSKTELDSMISEKIELALQLDQVRQQSASLAAKLSNSETDVNRLQQTLDSVIAERDTLTSSLVELDDLRGALLDTEGQFQSLKAEHEQLLVERDSLPVVSTEASQLSAAPESPTTDETSQLRAELQQASTELRLTIADRDSLMKEISELLVS